MPAWSLPRRIVFRFAVVCALLLIYPFPLQLVPGSYPLYVAAMAPVDAGVRLVAEYVLGIAPPVHVFTGSGDTLWHFVHLLFVAIVAGIATAVWSALDRRTSYPRLQASIIVLLRYYLAMMMLVYGLAKVFVGQFAPISLARADQSIGEMSPMGMLWTFMGSSRPYTMFGGIAEVLGGVLLLVRRTSVIGALVVIVVMANVVVLNFTYDVPVKLFSMELLAMAIAIALPSAQRLMRAALGRAIDETPPRVRGSLTGERIRLTVKLGMLGAIAAACISYAIAVRQYEPVIPPLHGSWAVDTFILDGEPRIPLLTDDDRWRKLIVTEQGLWIRFMTDRRGLIRNAQIDPDTHTIVVPDGVRKETWRYDQPDAEHLVLHGVLRGHAFDATCTLEPAPLLVTRGFHWIQEAPFHR